jgi:hypothetical protein
MASIYDSPGQQVALTGSQANPSFQPVEAYDPSRQLLQQSERDLRAFAEFSETLSGFIVQKQKEKNKADFDRERFKVLNGELTPNPEAFQKYKQNVQLLKEGAAADQQVVNQLEAVDVAAAESFRKQSRRLNEWERLGQATGLTELAAGNAESFFNDFLTRSDVQIPITLADGTTKLITPSTPTDDPELKAVLAFATQEFVTASKLDNINPAILSEYLVPTLMRVKQKLSAEKMQEININRKGLKQETLIVKLNNGINTLKDPELGQNFITSTLEEAKDTIFGGDYSKANTFVFKQIQGIVSSLPPAEGQEVLDKVESYYLNPEKPELGTFGQRFLEETTQLRKSLSAEQDQIDLKEEQDIAKRSEDIISEVTLAQTTGNLQEAQKVYDKAFEMFTELGKTNPAAAAAGLLKLKGFERNYSKANEEAILRTINNRAQLNALYAEGYIGQDAYNAKKADFVDDVGEAKLESLLPSLIGTFRTDLIAKLSLTDGDPENARATATPFAKALAYEALVYGKSLEAAARKKGEGLTVTYLTQELLDWGRKQLETNKRYEVGQDASGKATLPYLSAFGADRYTVKAPPSIKNLVNAALTSLPPVVSSYGKNLSAEEIQRNVDAIKAGGKPDERTTLLASAAGVDPYQLLKAQAKPLQIDVSGMDQSAGQKIYQANFAINPTAARILANPRSSPLQISQARSALTRDRNRTMYSQNVGQGQAYTDLRDAIRAKEGGAMGYNAANRGNAGDTPGGVPNLTGMTIQQVLKTYDTGGYNVLGGYQFKKTTLQALLRDTGIPLTSKFTPEVQDRLFESYFTNGSNGRTRLAGYVSGRTNDLQGALADLSNEFAAVKDFNGRNPYTNIAGNRATLDASVMLQRMRQERMGRGTPVNMSASNIQSVRIETPGNSFQPGMDLWFADKRFGAVLPGTVKEIRRNNGNYGNMIVVASTDPVTGDQVDVIYAHLDNISVTPGQRITPGQMVGIQGGTGRVVSQDGTIASVDFLAPAPAGSNSMTPYPNWLQLANRLKAQIESGRPL